MLRALGTLFLLCAIAISAAFAGPARQNADKKHNSKGSAVAEGATLYKHNCAVCHGNDATGGAPPRSSRFTEPAPDLTTLAQRHEGKFPNAYVAEVLRNGVKMPDHGPSEMPVWGTIFKATTKSDDTQVAERINALVAYLKSLQMK